MKIKTEFDETIQDEKPKNVDYQLLMLKILEDDTYFERKIKKIREQFQIPSNGYKRTEKDTKEVEARGPDFEDKLQNEIFELRYKYHFPAEWVVSLFHYVLFNIFIFMKVSETEIFEEKELYRKLVGKRRKYLGTDTSILIQINTDLKLSNLINQIKEKYPQIKSFFKEDRFNEPIKKIPVKNLDIYKKIYDLRIRKKKKFKDIAEELFEIGCTCSDSEVRAMLVRYQKLIKSLRKKE